MFRKGRGTVSLHDDRPAPKVHYPILLPRPLPPSSPSTLTNLMAQPRGTLSRVSSSSSVTSNGGGGGGNSNQQLAFALGGAAAAAAAAAGAPAITPPPPTPPATSMGPTPTMTPRSRASSRVFGSAPVLGGRGNRGGGGSGGSGSTGGGGGGVGGRGGGAAGGGAYLSSTSSFATQLAARPTQIHNGPLLEQGGAGSRRILRTARLGPDFAVSGGFRVLSRLGFVFCLIEGCWSVIRV